MPTDIIITNPSGTTGLTAARSLERHGLRVLFMEAPSARKMPESYIARLHKLVDANSPDSVWPMFFTDILAAHRQEFGAVNIPLDTPEKILRLDDKASCCSLAASLGILQPRIFSSPDDIPETSYPVVFKRTMGLGGDSVYFPRRRRALDNLLGTADGGCLITEFVEGDEISVDALRWPGYFKAASYKVLGPHRKGVSRSRISISAPQAEYVLEKILDAVDYRGVCGADFLLSPDGRLWFLECNPRFCGGLESALASGFDIPWIYWQLSHGMTPDPVEFTPGIITGEDA